MQQIADWLEKLGLAQYVQRFAENDINFVILSDLTDQDLEKIGVTSLGHRRQLLRAIAELNGVEKGTAKPATAATAPVPPHDTAERRQVTVMFSDLVGSTALSARMDPEDLREVISAYQKCVAETVRRFGGFVAKYMGDGVLVYFGYPQAHEDDAERAVLAGLELIGAVSALESPVALQTRIGIATGLVVVGDVIGSGEAQERGVVGETPNLAARLQGIAEPNTVMIAEATRKLLGSLFELEDLGANDLKGIAGPVRAWAVLRAGSVESRFEALRTATTPLVGRDEEVELLLRRWEQAKRGKGSVVLISGEPGIGKSRIAQTTVERVDGQPYTCLRYFCSPHHQDSALYPSIRQLERAAGFRREDTHEQRLVKLEAVLSHWSNDLSEAVPLLADLLSIPTGDRYPPLNLTAQKRKEKTLHTQLARVEGMAARQPVLVVFEDVHWSDPTTREWLDLLIDRVPTLRVIVIITFRPEFGPSWVGRPHVMLLTLRRLPRRHRAEMVTHVTGGKALPKEIADQIVDRTDGVPLFLEEVTKAVLKSSALKDAGDRWEYAGHASTLTIPLTLRDSLMARLDRFIAVKEIAQIGAAFGREFSYELIAAVASHAKRDLDQALAQLIASGLAFQIGTPPAATYRFKHALVQEAAYESLLKRRRLELHGKIARVIKERFPNIEDTEPELLAHHYTEAKQPEKAIPLWQKAGGMALKRMALIEAIAHVNKGINLVGSLPPSADRDGNELDLRVLLGTAWMSLRGWQAPEVWDSLQPALKLANPLQRNDALLAILWGFYINVLTTGRVAESLRWVTQILEAAETYHDQDLLILGHMTAANSYFWLGELIRAREHADQVLALYTEEQHLRLVDILNHDPKIHSLTWKAHLTWMLGYPEEALKISDTRDAYLRRRRHPFDLGFALTVGGRLFDDLTEPDKKLKRVAEAEQLGREHSLPVVLEFQVPVDSGIALIRKGQLAEGMASLKAGLAYWETSGGRSNIPYFKSVLAEGMVQLGDLDGALHLIDESIAQIELPGWEERRYYAEILRIKGCLLSLRGDLEGAERIYIASLEWARHQQAKSWELRTATSYARLHARSGTSKGSPRPARPGLQLVHRRLRHARSERG